MKTCQLKKKITFIEKKVFALGGGVFLRHIEIDIFRNTVMETVFSN